MAVEGIWVCTIEATPDAENWWPTIQKLRFYNIMRNGNATTFLLGGKCHALSDIITNTLALPRADKEDLLLLSKSIAYASLERDLTASLAISLANFQKFLVLSSCIVLSKTCMTQKDVYTAVRIVFGGQTSDRYCMRLLRTVICLNEVVDILNTHGWVNRASELLLICEQTETR